MKISTEEKYSLGEYVFFKMRGYPWWPGHIDYIENKSKKQIYSITDPFTNTISKINDYKNIIKFEENIDRVVQNAKGKKYINALILGIQNFFEGKIVPKKYEKIIKDLKEGNNLEKNKENINNREELDDKKNKDEEKVNKKLKIKEKENRIDAKNNYLLNKKRKPSNNINDELNKKKENKITKIENKPRFPENKEKEKENEIQKESPNKKIKLEGLERLKEIIREKEIKEQEQGQGQLKENEIKKIKEEKEPNSIENEEIESENSSISENKENNMMVKKYKNFDFYQIVKYLKRFSEYINNNLKEGNNSYFTLEDKKNFINLMEYLNNIEMNDTIEFLEITKIGNYINFINEKTKIKEFKELTKKFLDNNSQKIQLQLFIENTLDIKDI